jgi:(1->4)-alpha-D-glucan 1-alpha-D-glucosylmutase
LVGAWPLDEMDSAQRDEYLNRITQYMRKALREAKLRTSWMSPSEAYEQAVVDFIHALLVHDASATFRIELDAFARQIAAAGFINSLAQLLLKITLPGVPDFYQGSELWDFNLVDPDNRRTVDFDARRRLLADLERRFRESPQELARELAERWPAPELKLYLAWRALQTRANHATIFADGAYLPLAASGVRSDNVIAFARGNHEQWVVIVAPRHIQSLARTGTNSPLSSPILDFDWQETSVILPGPADSWLHELTGQPVHAQTVDGSSRALVAELFDPLPVALLTSHR